MPPFDLTDPLWKKQTSTVGLVVSGAGSDTNVQSAEWAYFVAKNPMMFAVVLHADNVTTARLHGDEEFAVTLCSEEQAGLADFCGSFSGRETQKISSDQLILVPGRTIQTPHVGGGVMALECRIVNRVELPDYTMFLADVVDVHGESPGPAPLVKHDRMFSIGEEVRRPCVTAGVHFDGPTLRVTAVSSPDGVGNYTVRVAGQGGLVAVAEFEADSYGDLNCAVPIPRDATNVQRVYVDRDGYETGSASLP